MGKILGEEVGLMNIFIDFVTANFQFLLRNRCSLQSA